MKTLDLRTQQITIEELLQFARSETVLIRSRDGLGFVLEAADDLESEAVELSANGELMSLLADRSREPASLTLEDIEENLAHDG